MKKIGKYSLSKLVAIIFLSMLFQTNNLSAQITLDHIVDSLGRDFAFKTVQISSTETKYFLEDTLTNTFSLYNMDFTPFQTNIAVPEPFIQGGGTNGTLFEVIYITRSLFDCDTSNIEYAYEATNNINRIFRIMRTDGTVLFQFDSANCQYCFGCFGGEDWVKPIVNTSAGAKLFLETTKVGYLQNYIYSLCGTVPDEVFDFTNQKQTYLQIFPNPSSNVLTFEINLPDNINEYELIIIDNNAKEMKREKININNRRYTIEVKDFSSGTYFYTLCTKNKSFQNGKFVINK